MMEKLSLSVKKLSLLCLSVLCLFFGCTDANAPPDYKATAFYAEVVYTTEQTRLCCEVWVDAPRESGETLPRNVRVSVKAPDALQGLLLTRVDGEIFCEYRGLSKEIGQTELLRCADLLLTEDQTDEMKRFPDTGAPERISSANETLEITNFKKIPSAE